VLEAIETGKHAVDVDPVTATKAIIPLERMLAIGAGISVN